MKTKNIAAFALASVLLFAPLPANCVLAQAEEPVLPNRGIIAAEVDAAVEAGYKYMLATIPAGGLKIETTGGDWSALALARSKYGIPSDVKEQYIANVLSDIKACNGLLHKRKYTEYSRLALGWSAIGLDATNIGGYNMFEKLSDYDATIWQGINGPTFALLAADSVGYNFLEETDFTPEAAPKSISTRKKLLDRILDQQLSGGGWALDEFEPSFDVDVTAMVIQALSNYQQYPEVSAATEQALLLIQGLQLDGGGFKYYGAENSESLVQVVVALCALGRDPLDPANGFVKADGSNLISALLEFALKDADGRYTGAFKHIKGGNSDGMAGDQCMYALVAFRRLLDGKNALYDMSDAKSSPPAPAPPTPSPSPSPEPKPEIEPEPEKKPEPILDPFQLAMKTMFQAKSGQSIPLTISDPTVRIPMEIFDVLKSRENLTLKIIGPYYNWYFKSGDITDTSGEEFNPWVQVSGPREIDEKSGRLFPGTDSLTVCFDKTQPFPGKSTLMIYRKSVFLKIDSLASSENIELYDVTKNAPTSAAERFAFDKDWLAITITEWRDYLATASPLPASAPMPPPAPASSPSPGGEELIKKQSAGNPPQIAEASVPSGYISLPELSRQRAALEDMLRSSSATQKSLQKSVQAIRTKYIDDMRAAIAASLVCELIVGTGIAMLTSFIVKRKITATTEKREETE